MKWIKRSLAALFFLYSVYVVTVFVFLSTPLLRKVADLGVMAGFVEVQRGWSWIPGKIELRNVHIEVEDHNIHLWVDLPKVEVRMKMMNLFKREVFITQLDTPAELAFSIRARIRQRTPNEKKIYIKEKKRLLANKETSRGGSWKMIVEDVNLGYASELAVDDWRYVGRARIQGGFRLTPGVKAEVKTSVVHFDEGSIAGFAQRLTGKAELEFKPFDVPSVHGNEVFRYLNSEIQLVGNIEHLRFLDSFWAKKDESSLCLDEAAGRFQLISKVMSGKIKDGSWFSVNSEKLGLRFDNWVLAGRGKLDWKVEELKNRALLVMGADRIQLLNRNKKISRLANHGKVKANIYMTGLDLERAFNSWQGKFELQSLAIKNIKEWNFMLPADIQFQQGEATLSGVVNTFSEPVSSSKQKGFLDMEVKDWMIATPKISLSGAEPLRIKARIPTQVAGFKRWSIDQMNIDIPGVKILFSESPVSVNQGLWWTRIELKNTDYEEGKSLLWKSRARVWMKNTEPVLEWLERDKKISSFLRALGSDRTAHLETHLSGNERTINISPFLLEVGEAALAKGGLVISSDGADGVMVIRSGMITLGLDINDSKTETALFVGDDWLKKRVRKRCPSLGKIRIIPDFNYPVFDSAHGPIPALGALCENFE